MCKLHLKKNSVNYMEKLVDIIPIKKIKLNYIKKKKSSINYHFKQLNLIIIIIIGKAERKSN